MVSILENHLSTNIESPPLLNDPHASAQDPLANFIRKTPEETWDDDQHSRATLPPPEPMETFVRRRMAAAFLAESVQSRRPTLRTARLLRASAVGIPRMSPLPATLKLPVLVDSSFAGIEQRVKTGPLSRGDTVAEGSLSVMKWYSEALSARHNIPHVAIDMMALRGMAVDHRAGFVLSLVDGAATIDDIVDACPMREIETIRILQDLFVNGVLRLLRSDLVSTVG